MPATVIVTPATVLNTTLALKPVDSETERQCATLVRDRAINRDPDLTEQYPATTNATGTTNRLPPAEPASERRKADPHRTALTDASELRNVMCRFHAPPARAFNPCRLTPRR